VDEVCGFAFTAAPDQPTTTAAATPSSPVSQAQRSWQPQKK